MMSGIRSEGDTPEPTAVHSEFASAASGATDGPQRQDSAPAVSLLGSTTADRCTVCSAELTTDQRYCVECGTRRGKPRFEAAKPRPKGTELATTSARGASARPAVLALGAVVLLLALGVGVLIGSAGTQTVKVVLKGGALSSTSGSTSATKPSSTVTVPPATSTPFGTSAGGSSSSTKKSSSSTNAKPFSN